MLLRHMPRSSFLGWRIAGLSIVIAALTGPGQTIGISVFIDHFEADLDISRSTVAACYLVGTLGAATAVPRWGRAIDQLGIRRATTIIAAAFTVSLAAMAGVTGVVSLALGFLFIRMLGQGALSLASTVAVSLWFERRRGFVLGVVITVSGALMALVPIALNQGIEAWGWRTTWLVAAAVVFTVVVPVGWLGLVDRPSAVGQFVDGERPNDHDHLDAGPPRESPPAEVTSIEPWGVDRTTALRSRSFWTLALVSGCVSWLVTALNFHQIALLGEAGLSSGEAAAMFLPQVLGAAMTGVAAGALVDRFGTRLVPSLAMAFMALTLVLAGTTDSDRSVVIYAVVLGATTGVSRTAITTLVPAWFGTAHLGAVTGALGVIGVAGSAIGPVALSLTAGRFGGWHNASLWWVVAPIVIGLGTLRVRPPEFSRTASRKPSPDRGGRSVLRGG